MQPPLIRFLDQLIPRNKRSTHAEAAGISPITLSHWLDKKTDPRLSLFEAVLNTTGYRLEIVPMKEENEKW